jgi:hypothetical protein
LLEDSVVDQNLVRLDDEDKEKLYFLSASYSRNKMDVKVKMKNMEVWVTDYNGTST